MWGGFVLFLTILVLLLFLAALREIGRWAWHRWVDPPSAPPDLRDPTAICLGCGHLGADHWGVGRKGGGYCMAPGARNDGHCLQFVKGD